MWDLIQKVFVIIKAKPQKRRKVKLELERIEKNQRKKIEVEKIFNNAI